MISANNFLANYLVSETRAVEVATYITRLPNRLPILREIQSSIEARADWQNFPKLRQLHQLAVNHIHFETTIPRGILPLRGLTELRLERAHERTQGGVPKRHCTRPLPIPLPAISVYVEEPTRDPEMAPPARKRNRTDQPMALG